jgi:phage baseplate assembly protein V
MPDKAIDNLIIRGSLRKTDDAGPQQLVEVDGRAGERIGGAKHKVPHLQGYGLASNVPPGAHVVVVMIGGNPDQAMVLGMEHAEHRPTGLAAGEVAIYDDQGQVVRLLRDRIEISTPLDIRIVSGGTVHINP